MGPDRRRPSKVAVIVAAAGTGRRMGADKLFVPLCGRPVLAWTLEAVAASGVAAQVVVAVRPERVASVRSLVPRGLTVDVVVGGAERNETVGRAMAAVRPDCEVVLVHDGARPMVSPALFRRVAAAVEPGVGVVPSLPVTDTLHRAPEGHVIGSVDRAEIYAAQTPQGFSRDTLERALEWGRGRSWSDEAGLVAAAGGVVLRVDGEPGNLKLTTPMDLELAHDLMARSAERRVGHGWDVHRLVAGRRLILGGIELSRRDGRGLQGHSDADALSHAVMDAVLGAVALGDIGHHFPGNDPTYSGADSVVLLARVAALARAQGWALVNADATVIADEPRLAPHTDRMRARLAEALGADVARVSVKAATSEGLQPDAISAHAVVLVERSGEPGTPGLEPGAADAIE
jgi:2-C-methyl-D-erythritol 4-phosphate cytidylyltransferase/2-C-methyl-D-erythritol 2,4-cyclodiphosphate synthase